MNIDDELNLISLDIEKLDKYTNITKVNKKHNQIKQSLNTILDTVNILKETFEMDTLDKSKKIISDKEYETYMKEINEMNELTNIDELELSEQIKKYKYINDIVTLVTNYMNSKKMEKIICNN
jgi:hypothetical protein